MKQVVKQEQSHLLALPHGAHGAELGLPTLVDRLLHVGETAVRSLRSPLKDSTTLLAVPDRVAVNRLARCDV